MAPMRRGWSAEPERAPALFLVALVHVLLAAALIVGLQVSASRRADLTTTLIDIALPPPPPPPVVEPRPERQPAKRQPAPSGSTTAPAPRPAPVAPTPTPSLPIPVPVGGGQGTGSGTGAGAGNGLGGIGSGDGGGGLGTELEQIAGAITPRDYPRHLREREIGGTVLFRFTVGASGLVTDCRVTRSSGVPELDDLTCRLVMQRFRYRPSTDRMGRPIADTVEGEHEWVPGR